MTPKKAYNEFNSDKIGSSFNNFLLFKGNLKASARAISDVPVEFGRSGDYEAYFVNYRTEIPEDFEQVAHFYGTVWIYDDNGLSLQFGADETKVFRRGEDECIIQLFDHRIMTKEQG